MTNTIHIMLDLETWGTEPGSDIRSIGACVFIPNGIWQIPDGPINGISQTFYIATDNPIVQFPEIGHMNDLEEWRRYDLNRDPRTVQWWSEQTDEARAAFADPVDLREALARFGDWYFALEIDAANDCKQLYLWSHGASFDAPILAAAYKAVGLPIPWHYRAPRDTRTAFDMAGIDDHSAHLAAYPGPLAIPHHALDDAICQARAVCVAYERVRTAWREDRPTGYLIRHDMTGNEDISVMSLTADDMKNGYSQKPLYLAK